MEQKRTMGAAIQDNKLKPNVKYSALNFAVKQCDTGGP